ncbi:MAG: gluconeogenesis factor YvcK family protein [Eubacteriales bacterium]
MSKNKGKNVVVFGGGTGLSILLRGLKNYTDNITAVVTVADDGGGSGKLREDMGMLPPGDIRNCLISLSDVEPITEKLMQHRFKEGYLKGQSFGNLFIAAMYEIFGDFEHALKELGSIFRITGKILPMTLEDASLKAELKSGEIIYGENYIPEYVRKTGDTIKKMMLIPEESQPMYETVASIREADVVVLGPGSLYTSVIPNILVKDVVRHIKESKAKVVYIANIMTQPGETDGYNVLNHLNALIEHCGQNIIDYVFVNNKLAEESILNKYKKEKSEPVLLDDNQRKIITDMNIELVEEDFLEVEKQYIKHDSDKLGLLITKIIPD